MAEPRTIKEVADLIGVSVATVSRAISKPERVSKKTRERVLKAIEGLNFQPNALARNLRTQEARSALFVVPLLSPPFQHMIRGAEDAAMEHGYSVLIGNTERDPEREAIYFEQLRAKRVDGFLLATGSLPTPPEGQDGWRKEQLPTIVCAAEYFESPAVPTVRIDNAAAADDAVTHLIGLGHERIAHIGGPQRVLSSRKRLEGYERGLERASLKRDESLVRFGDFTIQSGIECAREILASGDRPTAIFAANDEMALGAMHVIRDHGLSIPKDISIIGFDGLDFAAVASPPLTTVEVPAYDIGRRSMETLINILRGGIPSDDIILPTRLIAGRSTAARRRLRKAS